MLASNARTARAAARPRRARRGCAAAVVALAGALLAPAAPAAAQGYENARLLGFAGAQRALAGGNEAIFVNPAGLALGSSYSAELGYADDLRGSDRRLNASIADSQAGPIAGGLSYTYVARRPDELASGEERLLGHRFELALATLVAEGAAIGVTARYLSFARKNGELDLGTGFDAFTLDAGIQWRIAGGFALGAAGYNLTNDARRELPIGWGAGLGYEGEAFTVEADVRYNAQIGKAAYSGALGYVIGGLLPLRTGVTYDLANQRFSVSAGLGLALDRVLVDLAYRQLVNAEGGADDADERIASVSLRGRFF